MRRTQKYSRSARIRRRILTAVSVVLIVALGLLLACNVVIIVQGTLLPERPPSILGITPLVVLSGSMSGMQEGHIETGDLVFVGAVDPDTLEVGDIIAYMQGGVTITHRIMGISTGEDGKLSFTTKGDANNAEDTEAVSQDQLVGVYRGRIPKLGDFAMFLQKPLGMLVFIGVPLLSFILYDICRRQRYARAARQRNQDLEEELERLRTLAGEQPGEPREL